MSNEDLFRLIHEAVVNTASQVDINKLSVFGHWRWKDKQR